MALAFPFVGAEWRLPLIVGALLTEYFDGALSRWFDWGTEFGRLLDPAADKLFCAAVLATYFMQSQLRWFEALLVGTRDLLVLAGVAGVAMRGRWDHFRRMRPSWLGKATTTLQYGVFLDIVSTGSVHPALLAATAAAGTLAGAQYLLDFNKKPESL